MVRIKPRRRSEAMARWLLLSVLLVLPGCASPEAEPAPVPTTAGADGPGRTSVAGSQDDPEGVNATLEFVGEIKGAGLVMPDGSAHFVGVSTFSEPFVTGPDADLDVLATWDLTAPGLVQLILYTPDGTAIVMDGGVESQLSRSIHYSAADVPQGGWRVMVRSQGPAVVDYRIVVGIAYP
jgi:hypothetical protein